ncbi:hypothetical protein GCM10009785_33610 [Brooklawnia cerclae]|uniref:AAA family ATPase n=1 Tax=Brooklawnia cerclae TaxID=349934 RepID=A0ABX0SCU1_9ACTN|nr:AAA family ATPase [Brooklawnia cerclae]NIH55724.1 hypothetical protein [Brooklawnia cerclae]
MIEKVPEEPNLLAGLRTGAWLDEQVFPELTWIVPGLVPEGMTLLVGGPKIGKSWLSFDIALAAATGGRAVGCIPVSWRPVLLLALEDGDRRLQSRARKLLGGEPIPAALNYMTRVVPGTVQPTISAWLDSLPERLPRPLVILDTLGKILPPARPGESDYMRDYRVAGALKSIADARPGMAMLVLHHDRKAASDDFVNTVSGTNGIAGAADTIVVLNRRRNEASGKFLVTGRDVTEAEYAVSMDGCRWHLAGGSLDAAAKLAADAEATQGLGDDTTRILTLVATRPDGVRAADVVDALGFTTEKARQYLKRLYDSGRIARRATGLYVPSPVGGVTPVTGVTFTTGAPPDVTGVTGVTPPQKRCTVCGFPMVDLGDGATTHPACDQGGAA